MLWMDNSGRTVEQIGAESTYEAPALIKGMFVKMS